MDEISISAFLHSRQAHLASEGVTTRVTYPDENGNIEFIKGNNKIILAPRSHFYVDDIMNSFDYFFNNVEPEQRAGCNVADFSSARWHKLADGSAFFFTAFPEGSRENDEYLTYLKPAPGEIVVDLGAYCGRSAVTFARAVGPSGHVYSYEPDPENYQAVCTNIEAGGYGNITATNMAVTGTSRSLWFSSEGNMGSRVIDNPAQNRDRLIEVKSTTLQGLLDEHDLERFDVIKIDIEGSEYAVLENSVDLIRRVGARWLVEAHADEHDNPPDMMRLRRVFDACDLMSVQLYGGTDKAIYACPRL